MASEVMNKNGRASAKLFGLGRDSRKPGDPLVVTNDTTVWEIYNHRAFEIDKEMIKYWNDSLNTLLIFVSQVQFGDTKAIV
jgi:hypothetical protein